MFELYTKSCRDQKKSILVCSSSKILPVAIIRGAIVLYSDPN